MLAAGRAGLPVRCMDALRLECSAGDWSALKSARFKLGASHSPGVLGSMMGIAGCLEFSPFELTSDVLQTRSC
jgi:hypothetical protein